MVIKHSYILTFITEATEYSVSVFYMLAGLHEAVLVTEGKFLLYPSLKYSSSAHTHTNLCLWTLPHYSLMSTETEMPL
jgi:hypothetical protein